MPRDALKELWQQRHPEHAARGSRSWYRKALRSRIGLLLHFALGPRPYAAGTLANCRFPPGTNLIEGIDNKIKAIKRSAYDFHDDAYSFLKIRAAVAGVER